MIAIQVYCSLLVRRNAMSAYCPESPANAPYAPASPRYAIAPDNTAYVPGSPKCEPVISANGYILPSVRRGRVDKPVDVSKIGVDTFIGKLIHTVKNQALYNKPKPKYFVPISNWDCFVSSLRIHYKLMMEGMVTIPDGYVEKCEANIDSIITSHNEYYAKYPPKQSTPKKVLDVPNRMDHIVVKLQVLKSGTVRVKMSTPMLYIHETYYSKGTKPPIGEHLKALKAFGYPDEILEKVLKYHENLPKLKAEMESVFARVYGSTSTSKASKPKKKPVMYEIMKKLKNK